MSRIAKWVCSGVAFILGFLTVWRLRRPIPPPVVLSDLQTDAQASTELADAQEDHRETITKIEAEASDVRAGSAGDVACLLYTSPSPRDQRGSRMPSSA